jgi:hypothetical protein
MLPFLLLLVINYWLLVLSALSIVYCLFLYYCRIIFFLKDNLKYFRVIMEYTVGFYYNETLGLLGMLTFF